MDNQDNPNPTPTEFSAPSPVVAPPQPTQTPRKKKSVVIIFAILVLLSVAGAAAFLITKALNTKNDEISSLRGNLDTTQDQLDSTEKKVEDLDNPQKKANDTKRKNDLARFIAATNEYAANNNGAYPTTEPTSFKNEFEKPYITDVLTDFVDPDTKQAYEITPIAKVQTPPGVTLGNIQYQWPGKCIGSEFGDEATNRQAAARLILESGEIYCLDT